jgi:hypothetical protein
MAKDFLSYERQTKSKEIFSSDFATVSFGDEKARLVQSVQGNYGHRVEPRYEAGSSALYWVNGQPSGTVNINRLVGTKGWFAGLRDANIACALFKPITVKLDGDGNCDLTAEEDTIKMEDVILQNVAFNFSAGGLDVTESLSFQVSKMS